VLPLAPVKRKMERGGDRERAAASHVDELDAAGTHLAGEGGREQGRKAVTPPHAAGERSGSSPAARATQI
jgi:hypothetical protein